MDAVDYVKEHKEIDACRPRLKGECTKSFSANMHRHLARRRGPSEAAAKADTALRLGPEHSVECHRDNCRGRIEFHLGRGSTSGSQKRGAPSLHGGTLKRRPPTWGHRWWLGQVLKPA
jgi:hypothetical protein